MLGGIGSGKSHVGRRIAALSGGRVVEADALAHAALAGFAREGRLAATLGDAFVRDGQPDVAALGAQVFTNPDLLRRLEGLLHPPVQAAIKEALEAFHSGAGSSVLVLDVPLLIETGLDRRCDVLWYVEVADDVKAARLGERGLTLKDVREREALQSPLERKRARADLVIRNDETAEELDTQILAGLESLGCRPSNPTLGEPAS
jgi:dephospho-CoA kinase